MFILLEELLKKVFLFLIRTVVGRLVYRRMKGCNVGERGCNGLRGT